MSTGEILRTSIVEIRHHPLRSALTLLGIILGTMSITVMTSFLDGVVAAVRAGFSDLGYDGVIQVVDREARDLREGSIFARSKGLQPGDADVIMARRRVVSAVAPVLYGQEIVRHGEVERSVQVTGVTPSYGVVRHREVAAGRFIDDLDERSFARVCVLGYRLNLRLFGSEESLGRSIRVGSREFRVVGVGARLGNQIINGGDSLEEMDGIYVPLGTLRKFYSGEEAPLSLLAIKTDDAGKLGELKAEVIASLRLAHRGAEDFRVQSIGEEILRQRGEIRNVLKNWRIVLGAIAGISLLVGGIGLLSVMLISIGERLYEIGLRKAIGATDFEVFMQFLCESVVLALLGGLLGAGAGVGITLAVSGFFPQGLPLRPGGLLLAIGVALLLGVLYGVYPALKASRMEPVDALRSAA
ncbi:MAG TPA: ABC transporter permease [Candidatus Polarisedimenticolia bacterium]|nr:ABC transporter permease [Candidatus Polarisedimenticolia bacterium]